MPGGCPTIDTALSMSLPASVSRMEHVCRLILYVLLVLLSCVSAGLCRVCARGTYSAGGTMEHCKSCGAGWSSEEGSISWHDCYQEFDAHGHVVHHSAHLHAAQQPQQSAARSSSSAQEAAQEVQRRR